MLKIGNYELPSRILLAPLVGCSNLPFRLIMRSYGARFAFFEMIDANALTRTKKSFEMLETTPKDSPIAGQLLGSDPLLMLASAKILLEHVDIKFLDINAACPVKKVIKKKAGAYMLKEPQLLYRVIKKLSSALNIPITVKLRAGYAHIDRDHIAEIAKKCEKNGASAIFIHGRTKSQEYTGPVDMDAIRAVKSAVMIPVFGSGNIFTPEQAIEMMDTTGCDGILVARGSFGNPWIFRNIERHLKGKPLFIPTFEDKKKVALKHLEYLEKYYSSPSKGKVGLMRKAALWYMKGFPHSARLREKLNNAKGQKDLEAIIRSAECG
ncbi:tRNA dihydrouridine synthase DusB [Candidatus Margulisiibacteriota bacterium]